ncbi:hypothetical protein ACFYXC_38810 [Streptomyces sp. NPDC002701]|uniref:hypothetical protein n=1 Tax=Streptomyces sp. NPDC002701 TaxID=3364661 RepID=UPI0036A6281B
MPPSAQVTVTDTDKYSLRASGTPLLLDGNYDKKPAHTAVLTALGGSGSGSGGGGTAASQSGLEPPGTATVCRAWRGGSGRRATFRPRSTPVDAVYAR